MCQRKTTSGLSKELFVEHERKWGKNKDVKKYYISNTRYFRARTRQFKTAEEIGIFFKHVRVSLLVSFVVPMPF